jgi:hypothetical protein
MQRHRKPRVPRRDLSVSAVQSPITHMTTPSARASARASHALGTLSRTDAARVGQRRVAASDGRPHSCRRKCRRVRRRRASQPQWRRCEACVRAHSCLPACVSVCVCVCVGACVRVWRRARAWLCLRACPLPCVFRECACVHACACVYVYVRVRACASTKACERRRRRDSRTPPSTSHGPRRRRPRPMMLSAPRRGACERPAHQASLAARYHIPRRTVIPTDLVPDESAAACPAACARRMPRRMGYRLRGRIMSHAIPRHGPQRRVGLASSAPAAALARARASAGPRAAQRCRRRPARQS